MRDLAGDRDMALRAAMEEPTARAARRALERWTTVQRLWAAMDREGLTDEGQQIRFVCRALWPTVSAEDVEALVARATTPGAHDSSRLHRPRSPDQIVGAKAAAMLRDYLRSPVAASERQRVARADAVGGTSVTDSRNRDHR